MIVGVSSPPFSNLASLQGGTTGDSASSKRPPAESPQAARSPAEPPQAARSPAESPQAARPPAESPQAARSPAESPQAVQSRAQPSLELTEEEKATVSALKKTDQEVHTHEQAHKNAGGRYAGSASFGYVAGPDGRRYAVSGEVSIDISPVKGDPEATISKMNTVASAALAPAKPSGQDRRIAARAAGIRSEAQAALSQKSREALSGNGDKNKTNVNAETLSALTAYQANSQSGNGDKASGNIFDLSS